MAGILFGKSLCHIINNRTNCITHYFWLFLLCSFTIISALLLLFFHNSCILGLDEGNTWVGKECAPQYNTIQRNIAHNTERKKKIICYIIFLLYLARDNNNFGFMRVSLIFFPLPQKWNPYRLCVRLFFVLILTLISMVRCAV